MKHTLHIEETGGEADPTKALLHMRRTDEDM